MTVEPCGCKGKPIFENHDNTSVLTGYRLDYCPLHAAAEEMYNRLESLAHYMHILANGALNSPAKKAGVGEYKRELRAMRDVVQSTLTFARGQEPADDSEMPLGPIKAPARGLES